MPLRHQDRGRRLPGSSPAFIKGQGQQVIHHKPCRKDRGLGPFNCSGGIWAIRHQASAHPPHPSGIPRAASRIGPCALRWGGVLRCPQVGFPRFPITPPVAGFAQQAQALSRSAFKARAALVRSAPCCREGEPPIPYLRRCITGALQHRLRDVCGWCAFPIACFRTRSSTRFTDLKSADTPSPDSPAAAAPTCVAAPDGRGRASR